MTISNSASSAVFLGNGVTNPFSFNLIAAPSGSTTTQAAANIQVSYTDGSGNTNILSPTTYTLSFNANFIGGTILYPKTGSPIANGTSLTVRRIVPLTQPTSISNQGAFYPQVTESALDNLELQIQQVSARGGQYRGIWATGIVYNFGDMVIDGANGANTENYYNCIQTNTSGTWSTDLANGDWNLEIDIQGITASAAASAASAAAALVSQNAAASSASSASTSAATATTQAGIATTQAGNASTSAASALAYSVAAGNYANSYSGTSATSFLIGAGAKTFVTQANKLWQPGQYLMIASNANAANYMHGSVTSYNGVSSLVMNITDIGGSGTFADWNISISGTQGPTGPAGTLGTTGSPANGNLAKFSGATTLTNADLTGDVTTSGTVVATIANNAVTTVKINNSAVTLAKVANASTNSVLLGSGASGSGAAYSEIALGTGLAMTGTTLSASGGGQLQFSALTSSGTFTTSSSITTSTKFKFIVTGGGGDGGAGGSTSGGGGGGAGGTAIYSISGLSPSTGYSYTIGAAGANSSITINAVAVSATGGNTGAAGSTGTPGTGGGGSFAANGTINFTGGSGEGGGTTAPGIGGAGGASYWGGGGKGGAGSGGAGSSPACYGVGGGGGGGGSGTAGAGFQGIITVEWIQ